MKERERQQGGLGAVDPKLRGRRQVSLQTIDYNKAAALRDVLTEKSGRAVTITDTIARALDCLDDAHHRGAWLSPREAEPVLERRSRDRLISVLAQFIARAMPGRELKSISFDPTNERLLVYLDDDDPLPLLAGGVEAGRRPLSH